MQGLPPRIFTPRAQPNRPIQPTRSTHPIMPVLPTTHVRQTTPCAMLVHATPHHDLKPANPDLESHTPDALAQGEPVHSASICQPAPQPIPCAAPQDPLTLTKGRLMHSVAPACLNPCSPTDMRLPKVLTTPFPQCLRLPAHTRMIPMRHVRIAHCAPKMLTQESLMHSVYPFQPPSPLVQMTNVCT